MIPATTTVHSPAVSSTIDVVEVRTAKVEIVTARITGIDAKVPIAGVPVKRTIEVGSFQIHTILPVEENVLQVEVTLSPVNTVEVTLTVYAHQIVKVHFVCCFILFLCKIQLIRHFVGEEESLLASLLITHCFCRYCHDDQCCQGEHKLLHILKYLYCYFTLLLFTMQR